MILNQFLNDSERSDPFLLTTGQAKQIWFFAHLFVSLASPKILSFGNEIKNYRFCFAFRSLIRIFGFAENTFV